MENEEVVLRQSKRLRSLDAFRGLTISLMIFVNYGGVVYFLQSLDKQIPSPCPFP